MNQIKSIFQSKTFWLASAQAVAGILVVFSTSYPSAGWLVIAKSIVDIYLRSITTTAVSLT